MTVKAPGRNYILLKTVNFGGIKLFGIKTCLTCSLSRHASDKCMSRADASSWTLLCLRFMPYMLDTEQSACCLKRVLLSQLKLFDNVEYFWQIWQTFTIGYGAHFLSIWGSTKGTLDQFSVRAFVRALWAHVHSLGTCESVTMCGIVAIWLFVRVLLAERVLIFVKV